MQRLCRPRWRCPRQVGPDRPLARRRLHRFGRRPSSRASRIHLRRPPSLQTSGVLACCSIGWCSGRPPESAKGRHGAHRGPPKATRSSSRPSSALASLNTQTTARQQPKCSTASSRWTKGMTHGGRQPHPPGRRLSHRHQRPVRLWWRRPRGSTSMPCARSVARAGPRPRVRCRSRLSTSRLTKRRSKAKVTMGRRRTCHGRRCPRLQARQRCSRHQVAAWSW